jgi:hypothetical protein
MPLTCSEHFFRDFTPDQMDKQHKDYDPGVVCMFTLCGHDEAGWNKDAADLYWKINAYLLNHGSLAP